MAILKLKINKLICVSKASDKKFNLNGHCTTI